MTEPADDDLPDPETCFRAGFAAGAAYVHELAKAHVALQFEAAGSAIEPMLRAALDALALADLADPGSRDPTCEEDAADAWQRWLGKMGARKA